MMQVPQHQARTSSLFATCWAVQSGFKLISCFPLGSQKTSGQVSSRLVNTAGWCADGGLVVLNSKNCHPTMHASTVKQAAHKIKLSRLINLMSWLLSLLCQSLSSGHPLQPRGWNQTASSFPAAQTLLNHVSPRSSLHPVNRVKQ